MKKMRYAIGQDGHLAAVLLVDNDKVTIMSSDSKIKAVNGKTLPLRVGREVGNIIADGFIDVAPGAPGYADAVTDALEGLGLDLVA